MAWHIPGSKTHNIHTNLTDEDLIARHNRGEQLTVPAPMGARVEDDVRVTTRDSQSGTAFHAKVTGLGAGEESMSVKVTD